MNLKSIFYSLIYFIMSVGTLSANVESSYTNTLNIFETDGCSIVPDGTIIDPLKWRNCCVDHDIHYWMGGTRDDRLLADEEFKSCMELKRSPAWAIIYYLGVRLNAHPGTGMSYQWGYGWEENRGYQPLTTEEYSNALFKLPEDPYSLK
jgi:hypothetical protein